MSLVIWVFIYSLILLALRGCVGKLTEARVVKFLFLPGFIASLLVRFVTCITARAPIKEVNFPWRAGPPIVHGRPSIAFYGSLVFAVLPVAAGATLLLAIAKALAYPLWLDVTLPAIAPETRGVSIFLRTSAEILQAFAATIETLKEADWKLCVFVYAAAALQLYLAPHFDEWRPLAILLGVLGSLVTVGDWLGLEAGFMSRGWFLRSFYGEPVWQGLSLLVATALLGLMVGILAAGAHALVRTPWKTEPTKNSAQQKGGAGV